MDAATLDSQFPEFNLDPALAETIETAQADEIVEGILRLEDPNEIPPHFSVVSRFNRICTGRFRAAHTLSIRQHPNVISLKAARPLGISYDGEDLTALDLPGEAGIPDGSTAPFGGRGCIVAALDFGLDFAHPNFLNPDGTTRLVAFWHQGAIYDAAHPNRYGYGRMFSREEIDAALRASDPYLALGYHPAISDTGNGCHGTHTFDIAAGNGRVGRAGSGSKADLMFVHLSTPRLGVVGDLGDSVRMLEGLDYVDSTARGLPWVVNLSVGRTAGSHDGTSLVEQGMHELMRLGPGRVIVQSAGNYRSANLAVQGWLRDGEHRDLEWIVDHADTTDNELDAWYSGKDRFVIAIRPPQGTTFVEVKLGEMADIVHEGAVVGRLYHRRNDPNNRDNHAEVFLYPGAPPGVWTLRLIGEYVISGRFHAWIERDLARPGAQSRFDARITSRSYTLGTIATSPLVITVGAYDANADGAPLAPFSSCGPTRDERRDKPELLAAGVGVVAARSIPRGAPRQEGLLVARSGTSMAAPHVTGAVAAMFEAAGRPVSIDEIRDCLKRSAEPITDAENAGCCGWGRLNVAGAISRIRGLKEPELASAPQGVASAAGPWVMARELAVYDIATEEVEDVSEGQEIEAPLYEGALMNSDAADSILDRVERALRSSPGGREESERRFLERLLGGDLPSGLSSPADLFRAVLRARPWMPSERLEVIALPSQRPRDSVRAGDWIVRATLGTGDVGHIAVLASEGLLTQSMLASEGIAAESSQPGYYGTVIEGGAYPHSRRDPFARRFLDSSGRVPPHTVILRPRFDGWDIAVEDTAPPDNRKGLTFSSESKISASDMLKKINASKKLESWMKSVFSVKGNLLTGSTKFKLPKGKTVPKWFQLFVNTSLSNTTHVTTGEVRMEKAGVSLYGDYDRGDFPGNMVTTGKGGQKTFIGYANPDKYADNVITLGIWHRDMVDDFAGWDGKNGLRSVERRVVVIGNRQAFGKDTAVIDDEKILDTFFHEVSAHQGVHDDIEFNEPKVSATDRLKRSQHSIMWVTTRTPDPSIDSDVVAKEVEDFFGTKIDRTLYDKAKKAFATTATTR